MLMPVSTAAAAVPSTRTQPAKPSKRDPAKTRASIVKAATIEFAAKGYSGARTEQIAKRAKTNIRMLYHYFGGKDGLYIVVLEEELARLRADELQLDFSAANPLDGVLQMFDFIDGHFSSHPALRSLLAFENLNKAAHLKRSARIPQMASPVLALIGTLLQRGEASGTFRPGIDALHLYVAMVSLAYYAKSHAHTLSRIFQQDLLAPDWQQAHRMQTHQMLAAFLAPATMPAPPRPARPKRRTT
jgi:AcrR family transcriptional regulator